MPRNGSGLMAIINVFSPSTTISSSQVNANLADIADEITNSVAVDGQSVMVAPLQIASGTAAAPSLTFGADTDTGFYRTAANKIGIAIGGDAVAEISAAGLELLLGNLRGPGSLPAGSQVAYAGATAPAGWLLEYGQAVSRTTYADLFAAIGTTFGSGDGSTTFNVPDKRGRASFGKDDMGGTAAGRITSAGSGIDGATLGAAGGTETHTLTKLELPTLGLAANVTDPGHPHTVTGGVMALTNGGGGVEGTGGGSGSAKFAIAISPSATGITVAIPEIGGDDPHNNMPGAQIDNWIIKT